MKEQYAPPKSDSEIPSSIPYEWQATLEQYPRGSDAYNRALSSCYDCSIARTITLCMDILEDFKHKIDDTVPEFPADWLATRTRWTVGTLEYNENAANYLLSYAKYHKQLLSQFGSLSARYQYPDSDTEDSVLGPDESLLKAYAVYVSLFTCLTLGAEFSTQFLNKKQETWVTWSQDSSLSIRRL